jgi:polyphosphate kinase 2 (PPK2 family)
MAEDKDTKELIKELREQLIGRIQKIREAKIPILILVEGWAAAGRAG